MFLLSSLTMVVVAFIVIYFVTARMVKPLRDMLAATQSFSRGDYTVRVQVNSSDEIGQLANEFNYMAEALARNEAMNRSFVANVSHELKLSLIHIYNLPPESRVRQCKDMMFNQLNKLNMVDAAELKAYINRIVDDMDKAQLAAMEKAPLGYAAKIRDKIETLLEAHYRETFDK